MSRTNGWVASWLTVLMGLASCSSSQPGDGTGSGGAVGSGGTTSPGQGGKGGNGGGAGGQTTPGTGGQGGLPGSGGSVPATGGQGQGGATGSGGGNSGSSGSSGTGGTAGIDAATNFDVSVTPDATGDVLGPPPANRVKGIVSAGYSSLKVFSRDGITWDDTRYTKAGSGDDVELLRSVGYFNGVWIAAGFKIWRSIDGAITWTYNPAHKSPCPGAIETLTTTPDGFFTACFPPSGLQIFKSTDGIVWTMFSKADIAPPGHQVLAHHDGLFTLYGESGTTWQSKDATTWTVVPGLTQGSFCNGPYKNLASCEGGAVWRHGAFFKTASSGAILRSPGAGMPFQTVFAKGSVYKSVTFAEGYVAAP